MPSLTIGKVAKLANVGVETVRFYERTGLIDQPPRRKGEYRQYPRSTVQRVRFIRRAKDLGFSLKQIRELLDLRMDPDTTCRDIRRRAERKIEEVDEKIRDLRRMHKALKTLAATCRGKGPLSECPIIDALEDGTKR